MELLVFIFSFLLPTQFGKHFFFPFSYLSGIRVDYLAPTIYLTDIVSLVLILMWLLPLVKEIGNWKRRSMAYILPAFVFIILILINCVFSLSKPLWLYGLVRVAQFVFLFWFFRHHGKRKSVYSALVWGLFLGACFELTLSLFQLSTRHSIQGLWYYFGERSFSIFTPGIAKAYFMGKEFLRPYGTFSHPNSLGGFYLLVYIFTLTQKRISNVPLRRAFLFVSSALVLISFSRSAIVVYVVINLLYFSRNFLFCKACFLAKLSVAFVLILFALTISGDINSFQKRTDFMQKSLSIIAQKPFTGTGIGSYLIAQHAYPQKFSTFFEQPVHNIFLLVIAQVGIPLSILIFILIFQRIHIKIRREYFLLPLLCILITGSVDHYWVTLQQNVLVFAVLFGILFVYEETSA
ncbi:MAG: O-antigen ligase family protein [bacterium]